MHPALEIDAKLHAYLEDRDSLDELQAWFRQNAGSLLNSPEGSRALELAASLQLVLIEHDKGGFSERQMKSHLRRALTAAPEAPVTRTVTN